MTVDALPFPPAGRSDRFDTRWHLVGAGVSNVWRFGDLTLPAASGRLLLRGPNGTGKTTALEGLWPFLLDLKGNRLPAGKARTTSLKSLMETGATGRRRYGYVWVEFAAAGGAEIQTFGVRLQYSQGASPAVRTVPFTVPGRLTVDVSLHGPGRAALSIEDFTAAVSAAGGEVFDDDEPYVARLATSVLRQEPREVNLLADRIRQVRNPTLLGEVSPREAAEALRASLPGVDRDVIAATADALAESNTTREAFERDERAAEVLADFAAVWTGHVVETVRSAYTEANELRATERRLGEVARNATADADESRRAAAEQETVQELLGDARARIDAAEKSEEYKAHGRLDELRKVVELSADNAGLEVRRLRDGAGAAAQRSERLIRQAEHLRDDIDEQVSAAGGVDPAADPGVALVVLRTVPQPPLTAGGTTVDPGPSVQVDGAVDRIEATRIRWATLSADHRTRVDAAELARTDHDRTVRPADDAATDAEMQHGLDAAAADEAAARVGRATQAAAHQVATLVTDLAAWVVLGPVPGGDPWAVDGLAAAEPSAVLARADEWASSVRDSAAGSAAALDTRVTAARNEAAELAGEAGDHRAEAGQLRTGRLLPLPRPGWAGPGDDAIALGAVLEWADGFQDGFARGRVEAALSAAGVLGATLYDDDAARTAAWVVATDGAVADRDLTELVTADPAHPRAVAAAAVLARIGLTDSAVTAEPGPHLLIGLDGSFRAGVLSGQPLQVTAAPPIASHVGARQRLRAALARAEQLDAAAAELERRSAELIHAAERMSQEAAQVRARAATFPSRQRLLKAETARVTAAEAAGDAAKIAGRSAERALELRSTYQAERRAWVSRTRIRDLPTDLDELAAVRDSSRRATEVLGRCAAALRTKFVPRLRALLEDVRTGGVQAAELTGLAANARTAHKVATRAEAELDELQKSVGAPVALMLTRLATARADEQLAKRRLDQAQATVEQCVRDQATTEARREEAVRQADAARPANAAGRQRLSGLLDAPGVRAALELPPANGDDLLAAVHDAILKRRGNARKTVRERYDQARAALAGTWALDPGDSCGELDTYALVHQDQTYTPHGAAQQARALRDRAHNALATAEERALREFVIGRLPRAIGVAWQSQKDWTSQVNRKMRTAAASSGVGVQVRIGVRDDLSPAVRTVYEMACKIADAARSPAQQAQISQALQALIGASGGEDMTERVAAAVDVRDWVTVRYEVEGPGQPAQTWGSRTGMSGGERRLVVLAPMLAALAAAYDRAGAGGLRLVALDEVPAEVDEEGRMALARYLAELDLDLICTSYLWDGAPGAWDGIDAYDLEADADGTVVGFPMLVRRLLDLPADRMTNDPGQE